MLLRSRISLSLCAALAWPALATAQAVFTSQERLVHASSESVAGLWQQGTSPFPPNNDPPAAVFSADHADETPAPDFGSFTASASSPAPPPVGSVVSLAFATSTQTSSLTPHSITASGGFAAAADSEFIFEPHISELNALLQPPVPYIGGILQGSESAQTLFTVEFSLNAPTPYHLVGNVAHTPGTIGQVPILDAGSAAIALSGPSGSVAAVSLSPIGGSEDLDVQGVLATGSYTLSAHGSAFATSFCDLTGCHAGGVSGSYELTLTLEGAEVPGPSRGAAALLGLALAAVGYAALRRA